MLLLILFGEISNSLDWLFSGITCVPKVQILLLKFMDTVTIICSPRPITIFIICGLKEPKVRFETEVAELIFVARL